MKLLYEDYVRDCLESVDRRAITRTLEHAVESFGKQLKRMAKRDCRKVLVVALITVQHRVVLYCEDITEQKVYNKLGLTCTCD